MPASRQIAARSLVLRIGCIVLPMLAAPSACGCKMAILTPAMVSDVPPADALAGRKATKPEPRTIPFELVFVRHGEQDPQMTADLWNLADEQAIDADIRRQLNANGLRAGIVSAILPPELQSRFTATTIDPSQETTSQQSMVEAPTVVRRTMRLLPGRENELLTASTLDELILMECLDGGVQGSTYRDASAIFTLRAWPAASGRVRVQLCPVIKHGPMERTWVGDEGVFRLEAGQKRHVLDRLMFEATLSPDSMLLVTCAGEAASSVGDAFCRDREAGEIGMRLVALRPLARTADPLFAPADPSIPATADDRDDSSRRR
ncbi:MAG: hypothetical protein ACKOEX_14170 [Planctomycetia bacterium]